jgi:hypothetical protein
MRLTLRTLLAYLDDVLSPAEAEELRHRIEESEFASTLVQRIRHTVRRLRLSAPKVDGRGLGFDPNSVAEYLDSTMPADRVVDFEKVCLESDVHLAEVAACHQILAKVLSEPAHVSDELRRRVHGLPEQAAGESALAIAARNGRAAAVEAPPVAAPPVADAPPVVEAYSVAEAPPARVERPRPEVPEYLRRDRRRSGRPLAAMGLLSLVALAILFCLPPLNQYNPLINRPAADQQVAENPNAALPLEEENGTHDARPESGDDAGQEESTSGIKKQPTGEDAAEEVVPPAEKRPARKQPAAPARRKQDAKLAAKLPDDEEPAAALEEKMAAAASTDVEEASPVVAPNPDEPADSESMPAPQAAAADTDPPADESEAGMELGRFISDETMLATYDEATGNWMRVPPRSLILDGQRFVSLPVYRPQVALASGVQITLVGEASVRFGRPESEGVPRLSVEHGRLLLHSIALANVKSELDLNGIRGMLTLDSADSEAALDVYSYLPPGEEAAADASLTVVNLIGVSGTVTWQERGAEAVTLEANEVLSLVGDEDARRQGPVRLPAWIDSRNTSSLDREAAKMVEPLVAGDRPLVLALEELANHRRLDVRVHVARCLAYLGQYELLVRQLSEEEYRSYWMRPEGHLDTLRRQVARGGQTAEQLRDQLIQVRGERDGAALFRMLQGYSEQQLLAGAADVLVTALAHPNMDIRVVAIDNLNRITGAMHLYNAWLPPEKSRPRILKWQELLKDGEITYTAATKPDPDVQFERLGTGEEPAAK